MKFIKIFLILIVLAQLNGCKKDKPTTTGSILSGPDFCAAFPSVGSGQLEFLEDSIQFKLPVFNPQNQNEIVYNYINYATWPWTTQLVKYNLVTKQKQVLMDNVYLNFAPAWTDLGWIAFDNGDAWILKIQSNGSNLEPFATNNFNGAPSWSEMDSSLIWVQNDFQTGNSSFLKQNHLQGTYDTLISPAYKVPIISNNKILLLASVDEFRYYDLKTAESFDFFDNIQVPISLAGITKGMCWHPYKPVFYACKFHLSNFGLYEINYLTGSYRKIMDFCDSKQYTHISCSPDGNYLIGQRLDCYQKIANNGAVTNNIVQNSSIYKIHIQTGTETKINL